MKKIKIVRLFVIAIMILILMLFIPWAALADFIPTNGHPASLVLGQPDFFSNTIATSQTGMSDPGAVAVDPLSHKVFVADRYNNRVLRFASVTALTDGAAAEAVLGQAGFASGDPNRGGTVDANTMWNPYGVFVDSAGRLWVSDDANNRVLYFNHAANIASGSNADGVLGQPDFTSGAVATTQNGMKTPTHVFVTRDGQLWVAEYGNSRVIRFDNAADKPNGANADGVLGQPDFNHSAPATTRNGMAGPVAVYVDLSGRLWVAEYLNNRVLRFDNAASKSNGANANGVLGQPDFTSDGFACASNRMHIPRGVSGDFVGRLFVSDGDNHRVLIFLSAAGLPNGAEADIVLGQTNFTTCTANSGGISASSLKTPSRLFYDQPTRVLWVADRFNERVLMYGRPRFRHYLPVVNN